MDERPPGLRLAVFVSAHGFGHATRAAALLEALTELRPDSAFEIFTQAPAWLFQESLPGPFRIHPTDVDVGLVQRDPFHEDLPATLARLQAYWPFPQERVQALADAVRDLGCQAVLCDIAPLGLAVARRAGLPGILVENFTWDWIYQGYLAQCPELAPFVEGLAQVFAQADLHIQTEPICRPVPGAHRVPILGRGPRRPRPQVREMLEVPLEVPLVLVTAGGVPWSPQSLAPLAADPSVHYLLGGVAFQGEMPANVHRLERSTGLYHPDVVAACNAVVGKIGYSTLAEVHAAGVPFGYVVRPGFREAEVLARFARAHLPGLPIQPDAFLSGAWVSAVPRLLALDPVPPAPRTGPAQAARLVLEALSSPRRLRRPPSDRGPSSPHPSGGPP